MYINSYCVGFCYWLLNTSWQQLSPSQTALVTAIYTAGVSGSSVTQQQFNNFTQATSWRQKWYDFYLGNQLPYSAPPVGVCDFWLNPAGLQTNTSNAFGVVTNQGNISQVNDILGSSVTATQATASRLPSLLSIPHLLGSPGSFGINASAVSCLNLNNASGLTNASSGYSIFCIASCVPSGSIKSAFYFSSGSSGGAQRIGIACNTAGQFIGQAKRLDADVQATLTGAAASTAIQIIAFTVEYSTGKGILYQNGIATATNNSLVSSGSSSATNSVAVQVGALNSGSLWNGLLVDCLAFQTALSASNVLTITNWLNGLRGVF